MLGDGCALGRGNERNTYIRMGNTEREFLQWTVNEIGIFARPGGVTRKATAKQARENTPTIAGREVVPRKDKYTAATIGHPLFNHFDSWYTDGEKEFPEWVDLSPPIVRVWYAGDGSLYNSNCSRPTFYFKGQEGRSVQIASWFNKFDIFPNAGEGRISISPRDLPAFQELIGDPIPGYEYKWNIKLLPERKEFDGTDFRQTVVSALEERANEGKTHVKTRHIEEAVGGSRRRIGQCIGRISREESPPIEIEPAGGCSSGTAWRFCE